METINSADKEGHFQYSKILAITANTLLQILKYEKWLYVLILRLICWCYDIFHELCTQFSRSCVWLPHKIYAKENVWICILYISYKVYKYHIHEQHL